MNGFNEAPESYQVSQSPFYLVEQLLSGCIRRTASFKYGGCLCNGQAQKEEDYSSDMKGGKYTGEIDQIRTERERKRESPVNI